MQTLTKRERWLISIIFIIIFLVGLIYTYSHRTQEAPAAQIKEQQKSGTEAEKNRPDTNAQDTVSGNFIKIDVKGAVNHPGVYSLPAGARVADAINAAGGLSSQGDTDGVNLASILIDGGQVMIPSASNQTNQAIHSTTQQGKIDINTATEADFEKLSGVGPSRAQQIVTYREQHGLFQSVDDLLKIDGFGPKLLQKIKDQLTVY